MKYAITKELSDRFRIAVSVNVIIAKDDKYLLLRRANTGWADGYYTLPAGHVDGNESLTSAAAREVKEEVGLSVRKENFELVHVMHRSDKEDDQERLDFYFLVNQWEGDPYLSEPEKSDRLDWFALNELPDHTLENVKNTLKLFKDQLLSEVNW